MIMIMILQLFMEHVKNFHLGNFIDKMGINLKRTSFVYPIVL